MVDFGFQKMRLVKNSNLFVHNNQTSWTTTCFCLCSFVHIDVPKKALFHGQKQKFMFLSVRDKNRTKTFLSLSRTNYPPKGGYI